MKAIARRARTCAAVAVTGVAVLAGTGVAQAQSDGRQRTGDGIPTGQMGTQMFDSAAISAAEQRGHEECDHRRLDGVRERELAAPDGLPPRTPQGAVPDVPAPGDADVELFGHAGFPATTVEHDARPSCRSRHHGDPSGRRRDELPGR